MVILTNNDLVPPAFSDNMLTGEPGSCSMWLNKSEGGKVV